MDIGASDQMPADFFKDLQRGSLEVLLDENGKLDNALTCLNYLVGSAVGAKTNLIPGGCFY